MPSFDVVSEVNMQEVQNAFMQAQKEISQRYDFRGTSTGLEKVEEALELRSSTEENLKAAYKVLMERLVKRGVSLRTVDAGNIEQAGGKMYKQLIKFKQGIATDKAKEIVKRLKDAKLKVQAQIQDEQVRVTGKNRDDLQTAIRLLRAATDLDVDLQYTNFRD
jgi:uncharacterized protein YajQ (UPF0234 family)